MAAPWQDETLGAFGSASQIPDNTWFPVDTTTGQWGTPTPTLASDAGMPDIIPTRTMAPVPQMGGGAIGLSDQAPWSIGQASGTMAPPMTTPRSMQRVAHLDEMGALAPKPSVWESIARGIGMASPEGRAMLQYSDQQQQQQLQNRLTMRRQALQEEQNERAEIRDDFNSLLKLSEIKSKKLRGLYTDRFLADMQARGKTLPPDFVEAFKSSGGEEAKAMVKFYEPLLTKLGMDPAAFAELVDQGGIKEVSSALELAQKQQKFELEKQEITGLDASRQQMFGTLGDASGVTAPVAPGAPGTPTTAQATGARQQMAPAPSKDIEDDITEANRLYPQVRKDLIRAVMLQESSFKPDVTGSAGEIGLMQLKPGTAKDLGVDPNDRRQNVIGGTKYLAQQLTRYGGNEARALAAYNRGPGAVPTEGPIPEKGQSYAQQVLGHTTGGSPAGQPADTSMMVAGPGAPAKAQPAPAAATPQDQARLTQLNQQIAAMDQFITANISRGSERTRAAVTQVERQRDNLTKERDQLTEPSRAGVRARTEAEIRADVEERVKGRQTAAEVLGERVTTFFDKATGEQESPGQSMAEMRQRLGDKKVAVLSTDQSKQLSVLKQLEPVLDGYQRLVTYAYGPKGPLKDFSRQPLETTRAMWNQLAQDDPQLQAMRRSLEGQLQSVVRALGSRGDLNAQELDAAKQMLANFDASLGLGLSLGPMFGSSGMGVGGTIKPSISIPDTPETGMRTANELFDLVNKRIGSLLGNPSYARTKLLEIPEPPKVNPDDPRYQFGFVPPEVEAARQERARQAPQAPPQPPVPAAVAPAPPAAPAQTPPSPAAPAPAPTPAAATSGQRALKAMTPAQLRQLPERLVQTVIANPSMAAGLSPEQRGALMERLNQFEQQGARRR